MLKPLIFHHRSNKIRNHVFKEEVQNKNRCKCQLWITHSIEKSICLYKIQHLGDKFTKGMKFLGFFYVFKPLSFQNIDVTKRYFRGAWFLKVLLLLCFFLKQFYVMFIIKKKFYNVVHNFTSSRIISFLHNWDYCWKSEFNTNVKIK